MVLFFFSTILVKIMFLTHSRVCAEHKILKPEQKLVCGSQAHQRLVLLALKRNDA